MTTEKTLIADIGQGIIPKPLQAPHPPIIVTVVAPFSKGITEAASRGWEPISANFLMPQWVRSHWPGYVEGCKRAGRPADPANWRVAKSICVADDRETARRYATDPNSPYRFYYSQLLTKMKRAGRAELFKTDRAQSDDSVTLDGICDRLILWGTPDEVADKILDFREEVGDFGTLLLCRARLGGPRHRAAQQGVDGGEGNAAGECGHRAGADRGGVGLTPSLRSTPGVARGMDAVRLWIASLRSQ